MPNCSRFRMTRTSYPWARDSRLSLRPVAWARALGLPHLYIKDESTNPTGSFKARGLSAAVSMAKELGLKKLAIPSAGNAAGAMAAYAAHAGLQSYIFMPVDTPRANIREAEVFGAQVNLVNGLISDCGRIVARAQGSRRLVRPLHTQRALSNRRQENDGL